MEIWKQTKYENYEVSSHGNVRNTKTGNTLTNSLSRSNGYYKVTLSIKVNGVGKTFPIEVHRLVAETFLAYNPQDKLVVDHIDSNKLNNNLKNLQWITRSENIKKAVRKNKNPPFTAVQINEFKAAYTSGKYSLIGLTEYFNEKYNRTTSRSVYTRRCNK
ncbi:HNH endonuclease [Escherichia coli]|uniref:HNH endonuclease n=1 Tax=Enterobacter sp. TaxID=42895 RepID=UPI00296F273A|nr:HNH endonuclease [Enterobacter sp.]